MNQDDKGEQDSTITRAASPDVTENVAPPIMEARELVPVRRDAGLPALTIRRIRDRSWWLRAALLVVVLLGGAGGSYYWWRWLHPALPAGIVFGNGRLEADEINIDTKYAGRIGEMLADEGDLVKAGQVVARMDTQDLQASLQKVAGAGPAGQACGR